MTDILSQEEIDALLKAGLGEERDEESGAEGQPQKAARREKAAGPGTGTAPGPGTGTFRRKSPKIQAGGQVNVQPAVFPEFETSEPAPDVTELGTILNINLQIHVELGKTHSTIREVLEMGSGSVLELEKLNGEPVDLIVNKKPFAKGEMIVIGENFGVRVTDILSVPEIIEALR